MNPTSAMPLTQQPCKLFFLRGHMRSGTHWVSSLLNLHPQIKVQGEFHFRILAKALTEFTSLPWGLGSKQPLKGIAEEWFQAFLCKAMHSQGPLDPDVKWIGDHTPSFVSPIVHGAPYFDVIRDGRDVLVSWTFFWLSKGGGPSEPHHTNLAPLRQALKNDPQYFRKHPELLLSDENWVRAVARSWAAYIKNHFEIEKKIVENPRILRLHTVRYEALHSNPESEREALYRFLELPPKLALPLSTADRTKPGFQEEDPTAFFRKGMVGDWENYATPESSKWFKEEAGEELARLGYKSS